MANWMQRQELEKTVTELQDKITQREEADMQKNNEWKDLATKYKSERDEYKSLAEEGKALKEQTRKALLDQLSDDDKEFAIDLSTDKLSKFVARQAKQKVETNEAYSKSMPDSKINPFTEMKKEQRQNNWSKVLENYTKRQYRKVINLMALSENFAGASVTTTTAAKQNWQR